MDNSAVQQCRIGGGGGTKVVRLYIARQRAPCHRRRHRVREPERGVFAVRQKGSVAVVYLYLHLRRRVYTFTAAPRRTS